MEILDRYKKNNTIKLPQDYKVPDSSYITIYCEYTNELDSYFDKELIKQFFKEYEKNVFVIIKNESFEFKYIECLKSKFQYIECLKSILIVDELFNLALTSDVEMLDEWTNEELQEFENNIDEINIIKQCNAELSFLCRTKEEVMWVYCLSLYMSKYTDNIIVCDDDSGIDFKPSGNELVNMTIKK